MYNDDHVDSLRLGSARVFNQVNSPVDPAKQHRSEQLGGKLGALLVRPRIYNVLKYLS